MNNSKKKLINIIVIIFLTVLIITGIFVIYNQFNTNGQPVNTKYGQLFKHKEINLKATYVTPTYNDDSSSLSGIDVVLSPQGENNGINTLEHLEIGCEKEKAYIFNMSASDDLYSNYNDGLGYLHMEDIDKWKGYNPEQTKKYQCKIFGPNNEKIDCNITFDPSEYKDCQEALRKDKSEQFKEHNNTEVADDNKDKSNLEDVIENTFNPGENALNILSYQKRFSSGAQFSILFPGSLSEGSSLIIKDDGMIGYSYCIPMAESFNDSEIKNVIVDDTYSFDHDDADGDGCMFTVTRGKVELLTYNSAVAKHFADNFKIEINDIFGNTGSDYVSGLGSDVTDMIDNFDVALQYKNKNLYDYID